MKKIILFLLLSASAMSAQAIDFPEVVDASNDTLNFVVDVDRATQVEYFAECNDSLNMYIYSYYSAGGSQELYTLDSLVTTSNTGLAVAKILKGYGASGIVNLIPGATQLRLYCIRRDGSAVSTNFRITIKQIQ